MIESDHPQRYESSRNPAGIIALALILGGCGSKDATENGMVRSALEGAEANGNALLKASGVIAGATSTRVQRHCGATDMSLRTEDASFLIEERCDGGKPIIDGITSISNGTRLACIRSLMRPRFDCTVVQRYHSGGRGPVKADKLGWVPVLRDQIRTRVRGGRS